MYGPSMDRSRMPEVSDYSEDLAVARSNSVVPNGGDLCISAAGLFRSYLSRSRGGDHSELSRYDHADSMRPRGTYGAVAFG